jgi:DedD protein
VTGRSSTADAAPQDPAPDPEPAPTPAPKPAKSDPVVPVAAAKTEPKEAPAAKKPADTAADSVKMIYLQVDALGNSAAAMKEVDDLHKKGFAALVSGEGPNKLFRVQVGPFSNAADAETAKAKLVTLGFKPIRK